jgi:hypothetical protein
MKITTVGDLIALLQQFRPETPVYLRCDKDGTLKPICETEIGLWRLKSSTGDEERYITQADREEDERLQRTTEYFGVSAPFSWTKEEIPALIFAEANDDADFGSS